MELLETTHIRNNLLRCTFRADQELLTRGCRKWPGLAMLWGLMHLYDWDPEKTTVSGLRRTDEGLEIMRPVPMAPLLEQYRSMRNFLDWYLPFDFGWWTLSGETKDGVPFSACGSIASGDLTVQTKDGRLLQTRRLLNIAESKIRTRLRNRES